jgi:hypothetical protein
MHAREFRSHGIYQRTGADRRHRRTVLEDVHDQLARIIVRYVKLVAPTSRGIVNASRWRMNWRTSS